MQSRLWAILLNERAKILFFLVRIGVCRAFFVLLPLLRLTEKVERLVACIHRPVKGLCGAGGKSGQHRAFRFLMGSRPWGWISAEENNRLSAELSVSPFRFETLHSLELWVRVRRWGKSSPVVWWHTGCVHRKLKVHVYQRQRAARSSSRF